MSADELKQMLVREAEAMTEDERWRFIEYLRILAGTPPPRRRWLDRVIGPIADGRDVWIWLN